MSSARTIAATIAFAFVSASYPLQANATLVSLSFLGVDGPFDFNGPTGTYITTAGDGVAGITLSFTAFVNGVSNANDALNATASNYGINAGGAGDDTDEIDGVAGIETMRIAFAAPLSVTNITLQSITIGSLGGADSGTLTIGANSSSVVAGTGTVIPSHTDLIGQFLEVAHVSGNGFGFNGLVFNVTQAVPEPAAYLFGGIVCGVVGLGMAWRRWIAQAFARDAE